QAAQSSAGHPFVRLGASRHWARLSLVQNLPSILVACSHLLSLVPQAICLGATVDRRYEALESIRDIAVEAAATAIELGEYDIALEWLEAGRSIVWNQMLQFRTPFDELSDVDPALAERLRQLAFDLDQAGISHSGSSASALNASPLEQAVQHHRQLALDWDRLLEEARQLPNFSDLLKPKKVAVLKQAAQIYPIATISVYKLRCDALVLLPNRNFPLHIPLPSFSLDQARELQTQLLASLQATSVRSTNGRRPVFRPNDVDDKFESILSTLRTGVVKPVLDGPLAFLPLHAASRYGQSGSSVSDYVISSYTPTISALLGSQQPTDFNGILAVGHSALGSHAPLLGTTRAARLMMPYSPPWNDTARSTSLAMPRRTQPIRQKAHSSSTTAKSICEPLSTATGYEQLPDESVHLAARMMMVGYSSVIATMWAIRDDDAPTVAKDVYQCLLKDGVPDCGKAAEALYNAVACLWAEVGDKAF
ncbi:hypothetical protein FRC07_008037, partial [Ceratobasidium sp. 392]